MILGDWLKDSGWCSSVTEAEITSSRKAKSFLFAACHVSRTRYSHQVTTTSLHILVTKAYESYTASTEALRLFLCWKEQKEKECPQYHYWSTTLYFNSPQWCLLDKYVREILVCTFLRFRNFCHLFCA